jgi:hypothetical protein
MWAPPFAFLLMTARKHRERAQVSLPQSPSREGANLGRGGRTEVGPIHVQGCPKAVVHLDDSEREIRHGILDTIHNERDHVLGGQ